MTRTLRLLLTLVLGALWPLPLGAMPALAGGGCHSMALTDDATTSVHAKGNCFVPTVAHVPVGATVTWGSGDAAAHTVTAVAGGFQAEQRDGALTSSTPGSPGAVVRCRR